LAKPTNFCVSFLRRERSGFSFKHLYIGQSFFWQPGFHNWTLGRLRLGTYGLEGCSLDCTIATAVKNNETLYICAVSLLFTLVQFLKYNFNDIF